MTDRCFQLDELASLIDLGPDDPKRRHLAACPLCRARLAAYRTFITEGPPAPGSHPEKAMADLDTFIAGMLHGNAESKSKGGLRSRFRAPRIPRFILVPGLAAATATAVIILAILRPFSSDNRPQLTPLRGTESPTSGPAMLSIEPAVVSAQTVSFSWHPVLDADLYQVELFNVRLDAVACFVAGTDTSLMVEIVRFRAHGNPLWWRVVASREGDELAHSPLSPLDLGRP